MIVKMYDNKGSTKLQQFLELYPDIKLFVLDGEGYKKLEAKFSCLISNWEDSTSKEEVV